MGGTKVRKREVQRIDAHDGFLAPTWSRLVSGIQR